MPMNGCKNATNIDSGIANKLQQAVKFVNTEPVNNDDQLYIQTTGKKRIKWIMSWTKCPPVRRGRNWMGGQIINLVKWLKCGGFLVNVSFLPYLYPCFLLLW